MEKIFTEEEELIYEEWCYWNDGDYIPTNEEYSEYIIKTPFEKGDF